VFEGEIEKERVGENTRIEREKEREHTREGKSVSERGIV